MYYGVLCASGNDKFIKILETVLKEYSASLSESKKEPIIQRFHYIFPPTNANELIVHITIQMDNCLAFFEFISEIFPSLDISLRLAEYHGFCREHFIWRAGTIVYEHRHYTEKTYRKEMDEFNELGN